VAVPHLNPFGLLGGCLEGQLPNPSFKGHSESSLLIAARVFAPRIVSGSASGATTAADIVDFDEAVDDRVSQLLAADTGIALTYNDTSNELLIAATGGGGGGGGNVTPDDHPASADAMDDEFEAGSLDGKWSWRNQGSASISFASGMVTLAVPSEATAQPRGIYQTLPGGNWKIRAKLAFLSRGSNYDGFGMVLLKDSTNANLQFVRAYNAQTKWQVQYYTNYTAYGSTPYDQDLSANDWPWQRWGYFEIEYDGTSYFFRASVDGVTFATLSTLTAASYFTADRIGLMGLQISPSTGTGYLSCDWFRRIS
jgi:hypothetical protein